MGATPATRNEAIQAYRGLVEAYGFVPNLFSAQQAVPRAIDAEQGLISAIAVQEGRLKRRQKNWLLRIVASVCENDYCRALHGQTLSDESENDPALLGFALKLAKYTPWFSRSDVECLRGAGFGDPVILEAVLTIALGQLLCTLAGALRPDLDSQLVLLPSSDSPGISESFDWVETPGPYLGCRALPSKGFQPYAFFREQFGFVPNLFQEQMLRPDAVQAESQAIEQILIPEDVLSRVQKENILLAISAANVNTYFVAVHTQILSALGVPPEESDEIVECGYKGRIPAADAALLDEVRKLACPAAGSEGEFEVEPLRAQGFTESQIIEAVAIAALTNFLNTLQTGLGAVPDFPPRRIFTPKDLYPFSRPSRPTFDANVCEDPDGPLVARAQNGDTEAFEHLVRRHSRRVFSTLAGIVGSIDDARDATQEVFLKAFEHMGRFQGRSKFSTWLISIAINTGTELLRQRKPSEPLDEVADEEGFRPRQIQTWSDNPEQLLAASQRRDLVREGVLRLPQKYRVAVLLRDINQLSTEEAAAALGLSIPALKARLLRGRLMLRESLVPYFIRTEKGRSPDAQLR
jgi:RNA polymerase sigma-70 factor, ECF subfamily